MRFVFDENISPKIVQILQVLEFDAVHSTALLPSGTADEALFAVLQSDMYLVTQDQNMVRKRHQRAAMLDAGLGVFIFTGHASKSVPVLALLVQQVWGEMLSTAQTTARPFIFGISDRRRFERLDIGYKGRRR